MSRNLLIDGAPPECSHEYTLGRGDNFYSDVAANGAGSVAVVDARNGKLYSVNHGAERIIDLPFLPPGIPIALVGAADDSFWVGYVGGDAILRVGPERIREKRRLDIGELYGIAMSLDYRTLVVGGKETMLRLGADGTTDGVATLPVTVGRRMLVSNSGAVWGISLSQQLLLYDVATGARRTFPLPHSDEAPGIVLLPDGTLLVMGSASLDAYRSDGLVWGTRVPRGIEATSLAFDLVRGLPVFITSDDRTGFIDLAHKEPVLYDRTWDPLLRSCPNDNAP